MTRRAQSSLSGRKNLADDLVYFILGVVYYGQSHLLIILIKHFMSLGN